jgi:hypothetical protein
MKCLSAGSHALLPDMCRASRAEKGIRIKKAEMRQLAIEGDAFHPQWNCTNKQRSPQPP